jgi:hypothetical protein
MTDQHQHRATPEQIRSRELLHLRRRIEALEATQHAHIEAGARCAVEQMRSRPGRWQPLKVETTYGSDAAIPELSESNAQQLTLVERVADAILESPSDPEGWSGEARAAIRAVAAWINECELKAQNDPDCLEASTADDVVGWLHNEASR